MELVIASLAGVVVGALVAAGMTLLLLGRRADRDLIERRLRACSEYREVLGDLVMALEREGVGAEVLEQAWVNVAAFCREVRLTSWLFDERVRGRLEDVAARLGEAERRYRLNGGDAGGRSAQVLCEIYCEVDRVLRRELERQGRDLRRFRFLPGLGREVEDA
jgi:hypothetical protein